MPAPDILDDLNAQILHLVGDGVPVLEACQRAEDAVRKVWGGDRPYIKKTASDETLTERDQAIITAHIRGERMELLAKRYGMSIRWVREILKRGKTQ
jgi:Mor family transcriptional regulator